MFAQIGQRLRVIADPTYDRISWINAQLAGLPKGGKIIDIGAGTQPFRKACDHLKYFAQDFAKGTTTMGLTQIGPIQYGPLDYVSDCWSIPEKDESFDYALCTEVLEHVPYPAETVKETSRLLKRGGIYFLTVPSHSLRHNDPHWFFPGFSDHWLNHTLSKYNLEVIEMLPIGNYFKWIESELIRIGAKNKWLLPLLFPLIFIFHWRAKYPSADFDGMMCYGYFVKAKKL